MGGLVVLFLVVPFVELYVFLQVTHVIGVLDALALLIAVSAIGAWLVKREGIATWRRAQQAIDEGRVPATELVDGVLILLAGALLLTPGFVTDVVGIFLLLPPVRRGLRRVAVAWMTRRAMLRAGRRYR
jgi:UPF0716 protein FxsA